MNYLLPERLDRLAREYALGTLNGGARRRFERLLREAPLAQKAVGGWQQHFSTLAATVPPLAPSDRVWKALEQRLFKPAGSEPRGGVGVWLAGLWSGRALAGVLAGALLCALVLKQQPDWLGHEVYREALPASYVGLLTDGTGKAMLLASSRRHGRVLSVKMLAPLAIPAGRVAQLWALPQDGSAPFPVGTIPASGSATIDLADTSEKLFASVGRLGVSFEPAAAAPGARPSGDFVLIGHCVKLWTAPPAKT